MMKNYTKKEKDEMLYITAQVKDHIHTQAYSNNPVYKWLDESWSVLDILGTIEENSFHNKDETVQYLLDLAHLFGKDR